MNTPTTPSDRRSRQFRNRALGWALVALLLMLLAAASAFGAIFMAMHQVAYAAVLFGIAMVALWNGSSRAWQIFRYWLSLFEHEQNTTQREQISFDDY